MLKQTNILEEFMVKTEISLQLMMQKINQNDVLGEELFGFNHNFPLTTKDQLDELERKIRNDLQFRQTLVRKLCTMGGIDGPKTIRIIAKFLLADILLTEFSWIGTDTKKSFRQYRNIFTSVLDAVRARYPSYSDEDGTTFFKTFIKQARFRCLKRGEVDAKTQENSKK
ncbi:uncharacterized protein LOC129914616 [Episyrphus balteatus]|uniref:uncharacterized protein LOC129914616 n=1 Tax=Episyrphus balteatus TaxID=286459 RepID=UPI002485F14B|nr:uncharacterized protein LOC129914616 [Episyrphus balteatus]